MNRFSDHPALSQKVDRMKGTRVLITNMNTQALRATGNFDKIIHYQGRSECFANLDGLFGFLK